MCFLNVQMQRHIFTFNVLQDRLLKLCLIFIAQKMILSLTVAAFFDSVAYVMVRWPSNLNGTHISRGFGGCIEMTLCCFFFLLLLG